MMNDRLSPRSRAKTIMDIGNVLESGTARSEAANGAMASAGMIELFGLHLQNSRLAQVADQIARHAIEGHRTRIFFVNAHCINVASRDPRYLEALRSADLLYADGIGMAIAARLSGRPLRDNVNGTDLFPLLCDLAARKNIPVALLGGIPGIAERCAVRMHQRHPGLRIVWTRDGFYPSDEESRTIRGVNESGARMLFVARGVPAQELWIARYADRLDAPVVLGVGALLDFYSGAIPRCPRFLRRLRLEWAFRLMVEPRRLFNRYILGNPLFLYRAVRRTRLP